MQGIITLGFVVHFVFIGLFLVWKAVPLTARNMFLVVLYLAMFQLISAGIIAIHPQWIDPKW